MNQITRYNLIGRSTENSIFPWRVTTNEKMASRLQDRTA
jgi:hypothetical protein